MDEHPDALRADLQRHYGIDLDHAMAGEHTAAHVAALAAGLPSDALVRQAIDPDAAWTLEAVLLADLRNMFAMFSWGLGNPRKRGAKPKRIGPSWMRSRMRKLASTAMTVEELMAELRKPRKEAK